jgi:hypothetical protein
MRQAFASSFRKTIGPSDREVGAPARLNLGGGEVVAFISAELKSARKNAMPVRRKAEPGAERHDVSKREGRMVFRR